MLAKLTFGLVDSAGVHSGLVALFAVMVEAGAALGLFVALAHFPSGSKRDGDEQKPEETRALRSMPGSRENERRRLS